MVIKEYREEWIPLQSYSSRYKKELHYRLRKFEKTWRYQRTRELETYDLAQLLKNLRPESARLHLVVLKSLFCFIASKDYYHNDPTRHIVLPRRKPSLKDRHNITVIKIIKSAATQWLKEAIDLAQLTIQRRSDLVSLRFDKHVDIENKTVLVHQGKTGKRIKIEMGRELLELVRSIEKRAPASPYLVKRSSLGSGKLARRSFQEKYRVAPDYLTRHFAKCRDETGVYDHLPISNRPTFHSLRALGIFRYSAAGFDNEYIMALSGHSTLKMHKMYHSGHEIVPPDPARADLSLKEQDLSSIKWMTELNPVLRKIIESKNTDEH